MWTVRWHWLRSRCCPTITTICLQTLFFFPNGNAVPMKQAFLCVSHPVFPAGSLWPPVLTFYSWHPPLSLCGYVLAWILVVFCLLILLHGWRYLPSFSWEDYSPWRSCASPGSPSPLGWQYRLGRGGVRPPFGLFPVSFGEQVGSGVPLTVETWVLNLGLLTPWCQVPACPPPGQLDP